MSWFERLLDTVADHGRELIGLKEHPASDAELCHRLVDGLGEASNIALAREVLQRWELKDEAQRISFLRLLAVEFDPDPQAIHLAADNYRSGDPDSLKRLLEATEPPRQELFRRLNMAPGGTAVLVEMRAFMLSQLKEHPELRAVDQDLQHLLGSWFNRGFLRLRRIDWNSPAAVLEKLIEHEVVHPMAGWDDLRRRLAADRRCFAFFHPALPGDPLIFVEVALTNEISDSIAPLIDPQAEVGNPAGADTAIFYSINNALTGLRGVSFGNFLIKQVVTELCAEFPQLTTFCTLSPVPRLRTGIEQLLADKVPGTSPARLAAAVGDNYQALLDAGQGSPLAALEGLAAMEIEADAQEAVRDALRKLVLFYLSEMKFRNSAYDPVAHFHLSNGARLHRINLFANLSKRGIRESWGCMVNYRYDAEEVVENHEAYVCDGTVALSRDLEKERRAWN